MLFLKIYCNTAFKLSSTWKRINGLSAYNYQKLKTVCIWKIKTRLVCVQYYWKGPCLCISSQKEFKNTPKIHSEHTRGASPAWQEAAIPRAEEEKVCLLSALRNSCCSWPSGLDQRGLLCLVLISNNEHSAPALPFIFAAKQTAGTHQPVPIGIHRRLYKWLWGC